MFEAYQFLSSGAAEKLNHYFRQNNPLDTLGKKTVTVNITAANHVSDKTFELEWVERVVNVNGQSEGQKKFSGVFTIAIDPPTTQSAILHNPLGIIITDFNLNASRFDE